MIYLISLLREKSVLTVKNMNMTVMICNNKYKLFTTRPLDFLRFPYKEVFSKAIENFLSDIIFCFYEYLWTVI